MKDPSLLIVAASPQQTAPAKPAAKSARASSANGDGPSFDDVLESKIRNDAARKKEDSSQANSAQDASAKDAASAVAAQQQQQPQNPQAQQAAEGKEAAQAAIEAASDAPARIALQAVLDALLPQTTEIQPGENTKLQQLVATANAADAAQQTSATDAAPTAAATTENLTPQTMPVVLPGQAQTKSDTPKAVLPEMETAKALPKEETAKIAGPTISPAEPQTAEKDANALTKTAAASDAQKDLLKDAKVATGEQKVTEKGAAKENPAVQTVNAAASKPVLELYESKAIDPARLAEGRPTSVAQQVSQGLERMQRTGETSLRMQLYPEDLGRVNLKLTSSADGGVRVSITADTSATSKLLEQHLDDLKQALANSGVNILGLAVGNENKSFENSQQQKDGPVFAASVIPGAESNSEPTPASGRSLSNSYIDYRI